MDPGVETEHASGEAPGRRHAKDNDKPAALHHFFKLLAFRDEQHIEFVEGVWGEFYSSILMLARRGFIDAVRWETLGSATQNMLRVWAPKAKEYLETSEGTKGKSLIACFGSHPGHDVANVYNRIQSSLKDGCGGSW
jgi:hypothetical protein